MKNRNILKGFCVLLIVAVMVLPVATAETVKLEKKQPQLTSGYRCSGQDVFMETIGSHDIVWDNGMNYKSMIAAQWDKFFNFDAYPADDFRFGVDTFVSDVHWVGGYWNTNHTNGTFNWSIMFYRDDGTGKAPGAVYIGPFNFTQAQCNPVLLNETGWSIYYKFSVDLPEYILFAEDETYWMSIWGVGRIFPQSGWANKNISDHLHQAVFKSIYFGHPNWVNVTTILGYPADMCFQLTVVEDDTPPTVEITKPVRGVYINDLKRFSRIFNSAFILGDITIEVEASDLQSGVEIVEFYGGLFGTRLLGNDTTAPYSFTWKRDRLRLIHLNTLKVVAYDKFGNSASDSILVKKIL